MTMPETSVYENYSLVSGKNQVRLAWKTGVVKTISESERMQGFPYNKFWSCVLAPNARHHPATNMWRNNISHSQAELPSCPQKETADENPFEEFPGYAEA